MMENKKLVCGIAVVFVLVTAALFYLLYPKKFTTNQLKSSKDSVVLEVPVIEYKVPGNTYTEAVVKGYDERSIKVGEEFIIDPANLIDPTIVPSTTAGSYVGDVKLKLVNVRDSSIIVDILEDERMSGMFYPRSPIERQEIKNGSCLSAFPLVMDVYYEYCFDVSKDGSQMILKPRLKSESTMPIP